MLPGEEAPEGLEPEPGEAVEELLARMLEYRRYRGVAELLRARLEAESGFRYRGAGPPARLRRVAEEAARQVYEPEELVVALGGLFRRPQPIDLRHVAAPLVSVDQRLAHLRALLARSARFDFEESVAGADRLTQAVTLFALLELYKAGEADWRQDEPFGPIEVAARGPQAAHGGERGGGGR
jgi:segregation and condensation protein A